MKTISRRFVFVALVAAVVCNAAELTAELDPAQTHVRWTLGDVLHTVHGTFRLTSGTIHVDLVTGNASGQIVVDAASGESGSGARDGRMHRNVLESARFPNITFRPDHVDGALNLDGDSDVRIHGSFGIHGAEHELTVPAKLHISSSQMSGTIDFVVPYVKWGMKDPSTLFLKVKDSVQIEVGAVGTIAH